MLYEVRIAADSDREFAETLSRIAEAIVGIPANGNVFSFSRYRDPNDMMLRPVGIAGGINTNGGGLASNQENFAAAAAASLKNAAPEQPTAKRGRPAKLSEGPPKAAPTATVVDGPDGEPAAAMEESPFGNLPDPSVTPLTPADKRDKAIAILQSVFGDPSGPPGVRALQTKLKVKKFSEVPDAQCDELLSAAEQLFTRVKAAAA